MNEFHPRRLAERAGRAGWLLGLALLLLVGAFFRTQILQHDKYRLRAESNRLRAIPLPPARGSVFDRQVRVSVNRVAPLIIDRLTTRRTL